MCTGRLTVRPAPLRVLRPSVDAHVVASRNLSENPVSDPTYEARRTRRGRRPPGSPPPSGSPRWPSCCVPIEDPAAPPRRCCGVTAKRGTPTPGRLSSPTTRGRPTPAAGPTGKAVPRRTRHDHHRADRHRSPARHRGQRRPRAASHPRRRPRRRLVRHSGDRSAHPVHAADAAQRHLPRSGRVVCCVLLRRRYRPLDRHCRVESIAVCVPASLPRWFCCSRRTSRRRCGSATGSEVTVRVRVRG